MQYKYKIKGLDCPACASELTGKLQKIASINNISINFMTEKLILECQPELKEELLLKIKKIIKKEEPDVELEEISFL